MYKSKQGRIRQGMFAAIGVLALGTGQLASADDDAHTYAVSITNLTAGISFTPILAISHTAADPVFTLGHAASAELTRVAEGGDTGPLKMAMMDSGVAFDSGMSEGLLAPGQTATIMVNAMGKYDRISIASMLLPTNDGFIAINGMRLPKGKNAKTVTRPAYDAGTELNDELCASIPGPVCGGEPFSDADGEGFVHVHSGIHGQGDLAAAVYDWRNPVVKISIKRMD